MPATSTAVIVGLPLAVIASLAACQCGCHQMSTTACVKSSAMVVRAHLIMVMIVPLVGRTVMTHTLLVIAIIHVPIIYVIWGMGLVQGSRVCLLHGTMDHL